MLRFYVLQCCRYITKSVKRIPPNPYLRRKYFNFKEIINLLDENVEETMKGIYCKTLSI